MKSKRTAKVQAKVSARPRYVECEFPQQARDGLIANGSKPIKAVVWERDNHIAYAMLSEDPSGEGGAMEKHLSISASTRLVGRRMPTYQEVEEAAKAVALDMEKCQVSKYMLGVHLFCSM